MTRATTGPQPHANDWGRQNQADSAVQIGSPSSRGRSDCAIASQVKFFTRCRLEARRKERMR